MPELSKRYVNLWLDKAKAGAIEEIARREGKDVNEVVEEILSPVLEGADADEDYMGEFVLLRIPALAYRIHLKWFDGDAELCKASMVGSIENTADEFAAALKKHGK